MGRQAWSKRVMVRYALYQLPGLGALIAILIIIQRWFDLPVWLFGGIVALWVAKDVIIYPFVWRAYDRPKQREDVTFMIDEKGVVQSRLAPSGYIRIRGELWRAEVIGDSPPVEAGQTVQVCEIQGLTLLVRPSDGKRDGMPPEGPARRDGMGRRPQG